LTKLSFKSFILLFFMLPMISLASSQWKVIPDRSSLSFIATQNNSPVSGEFKTYTAQIDFDPHLKTSRIQVNVDMNSVSTSYDEVEQTLKTADWFNVKLFPEAVFKTTSITKLGNNIYLADGNLTLRDKIIPISFPFTLAIKNKIAEANGVVTLKRTQFGVGQNDWAKTDVIKNDVKVKFHIFADQLP